ncbi:MFS transporter [Nocardia wallacei]|uniref:MFS transporter n=1 Tax=Nocardia wallacei TaxID=480035 RepID=UPI002455651D|nr:MFS transporter [Nocardia wallacei]
MFSSDAHHPTASAKTVTAVRKWGTLTVACLLAVIPNWDLTALGMALPGIAADLDASGTQLLWIADISTFVLAGLLITMGGIGNRIGHRRLLLLGTAGYGAVSILAAVAPTPEILIAARVLLGVTTATMLPTTLSLLRSVFTDARQRTMALGVFGSAGGLAVGLGPLVSGTILDVFCWRAIFLVNVPITVTIVAIGLSVLPEVRDTHPARLDPIGVTLSVAGVLGLVYALKEATNGLGQARVIVAAALGCVGIALFLRRQTRAVAPLIDPRLFRSRAFTGSITVNFVMMLALAAQSMILAQYFQMVLDWSPLRAGLATMPAALGAMIGGAVLTPPLIARLGRAGTVALGLGITAVSSALLALASGVDTEYPVLAASILLSGIGMGLAFTTTADTVLASVPRHRPGSAFGISETATQLGAALGIAVLGTILTGIYRSTVVVPESISADEANGIRDSLGTALWTELPDDLYRQVAAGAQAAFVDGMQVTLSIGTALIIGVAAFALISLRGVPKVITETD